MRLAQFRLGELLGLLGAVCVTVALTLRWYEAPSGNLDAWSTFGPSVVLLMLAALMGFTLVLSAVTERSTALPVAVAVWSILFGAVAVIAAVVRVLERPDGATALCAGTWLAFAGAILILVGSWQALRDERTGLYPPTAPEPRQPPSP